MTMELLQCEHLEWKLIAGFSLDGSVRSAQRVLFRIFLITRDVGSTGANAGTETEQSFDPNAKQRTDQIRHQAYDNDGKDDNDRFVQPGVNAGRDLFLVDYDEEWSSSCDCLPDEDADEQSDDDGWRTSTDGGWSALDVFAADWAAGIEETADEAGCAAQRHDKPVAFPRATAAAPVRDGTD